MRRLHPGERVYHLQATVTRIGRARPGEADRFAAALRRQLATCKASDHAALYPDVSVRVADRPFRTLDDLPADDA